MPPLMPSAPRMTREESSESLRRLLRMSSPNNVSQASNRSLDASMGYGDFEPGENALIDAQNTEGVGTTTSKGGNYINVRSRESLRDEGMAELKAKLGIADREHGMAMEKVERPIHIREGYENNRHRIDTDVRRREFDAGMAEKETERRFESGSQDREFRHDRGMQDDRQEHELRVPKTAVRPQPVQQGLYDALTKAKQARDSSWTAPVARRLFGSASEDSAYEQALTNVIHRMGNMEDAQQVAAALSAYPGDLKARMAAAQADPNFEFDLSGLDPYTQEYLALKVK